MSEDYISEKKMGIVTGPVSAWQDRIGYIVIRYLVFDVENYDAEKKRSEIKQKREKQGMWRKIRGDTF